MEDPEADGGGQAEEAAFLDLEGKSLHEVLMAGHEALLRRYVAKAQAGTIGHQEAAILRNLLRDNGMTHSVAPMKTIEHQERKALPSFDRPDYEDA